jgi:dihydrolipoamide dehydrogenase
MAGVNAYKDGVVSKLYKGLQGLVKSRNITSSRARASSSPRPVDVNGERYTGRNVVLATGSYSEVAAGPRDRRQRVITSEHALTLDHVPASVDRPRRRRDRRRVRQRLEVLRRRGHHRRGAAAPGAAEDESSSKLLERAFRRAASTSSSACGSRRRVHRHRRHRHARGGKTIEAELLLVAVGRGPVSAGLGYEESRRHDGPRLRHQVDEYCQTNVPTVYAVGDLIPTLQLAHVGFAEGILVAERHRRPEPGRPDRLRRRPAGHLLRARGRLVGLTEAKAKEKYARTTSDAHLRPGRQRQEPDPARRRARSRWSRRRTARCSASTWSAPASAS